MTEAGFTISGDDHPISPVMLGDAKLAAEMADDLLARGQLCVFNRQCVYGVAHYKYGVKGNVLFSPQDT